jgi:endonuclease YncB( thermonuclease family)
VFRWPANERISFRADLNRVIDGDTLDVTPEATGWGAELPAVVRVRLADVDAPERGAPGAKAATAALADLVAEQPLTVTALGWDRFDRLVCRVACPQDVGSRLQSAGHVCRWPRR